jgi:molecular chaperone DnaJ
MKAVLALGFEDAVLGLTTEVTLDGPGGPRTFRVWGQAGVKDGRRIRLPGKGGPGSNGGPLDDLLVVVRVAPHSVFGRTGQDLTVQAQTSWPEAVLGTEADLPTLDTPVFSNSWSGQKEGAASILWSEGHLGSNRAAGAESDLC